MRQQGSTIWDVIRNAVAAIIAVGAVTSPAALAQSGSAQTITSPRPLADAADLLQKEYLKPVTYEDPVWIWPGDLATRDNAQNARWTLFPKNRSFAVPAEANAAQTPALNPALIAAVVQAYEGQNDAPTFLVTASGLGVHIVPAQVHDAGGQLVAAANALDVQVAIPIAQRTVTQHFQAICDGVSASTGTPLRFNAAGVGPFWLDRLFVSGQAAQQLSFSWGASGVTARAALVELMTRSATALSWRLFCQPSTTAQDRFCVLNVLPVR